jgi:anti-anti-sigma factor
MEEYRRGQLQVKIDGSLDMDSVPDVRKRLLRYVRTQNPVRVEIDFSRIGSIDTSAVAMLVELLRILSPRGQSLHLSGLREDQLRLFTLARLSQAFGLHHEERESG